MRRLSQKFSLYYIGYTVLVTVLMYPLMNNDRLSGSDPLTLNFIFSLAPFMSMAVLGALWTHELAEQKTSAYAFLNTLPLRARDIVGAKFLLIPVSILLFVGFHWLALASISSSPDYLVPSRNYLIAHANICLLLSGLAYLGVFRFGFDRFGKIVFLLYIVSVFYPIPLTVLILPGLGISRLSLIRTVAGMNPVVVSLVGLCVYYGLFRLAVRFKIKYGFRGI